MEAQKYDTKRVRDYDVKRKLEKMSKIDTAILPQEKLDRYSNGHFYKLMSLA